ncbi:hypothetical protein M9Y10_007186 [Tritrichomonas musculus]|uniref:DUF3447 domain-containing protein n=1 Tax=Tritrichomonas musculus TaxID=1915356 RepID=A0ABR2J1H4_9EUKA
MNTQEYLHQTKKLHSLLFRYLTNSDNESENYQKLISFIQKKKNNENELQLIELIHSIVKIADNYQITCFQNVTKLIDDFKSDFKKQISNSQLYNYFKNRKRLLLILFKEEIITIDNYVLKKILYNTDDTLRYYFYPEIKSLISSKERESIEKNLLSYDSKIFDSFEEKRLKGLNESYICELIRNDSIEKFKDYVNNTNFPISDKLKPSIFETCHFLIKSNPSPIEYAAFFGSIQICKYLLLRDVSFDDSIGKFVVNGRNLDLFHIFEDRHVNMKSMNCLGQAVRYRYYDIMNYIIENSDESKDVIKNAIFEFCFKYHNFECLPNDHELSNSFFNLCKYDYCVLVGNLLDKVSVDTNERILQENQ